MEDLDSTETITLFFDECARIEELCATLYHYYSELFKDNDEVSRLWKKTALEEENHQKQFELAHRLQDDIGFELTADIERPQRVYQKLNHLLEYVRQNPPDLVTALTKAIEMEENLVDLHVDSSVRFHDESIKQMFLAMRAFDQDHIKSLRLCLVAMMLPQAEMAGRRNDE